MAVMSMFTMGIQPDIPAGHFAVSLSVVTEDRLNMSGASFTVMGDGGTFTAVSDASGRAYLEAPSGSYTVSIVHAGEYTGDAPQILDAESRNHYGVLFDLRLPRVMETDPRVPSRDGSVDQVWASDGMGAGNWRDADQVFKGRYPTVHRSLYEPEDAAVGDIWIVEEVQ